MMPCRHTRVDYALMIILSSQMLFPRCARLAQEIAHTTRGMPLFHFLRRAHADYHVFSIDADGDDLIICFHAHAPLPMLLIRRCY